MRLASPLLVAILSLIVAVASVLADAATTRAQDAEGADEPEAPVTAVLETSTAQRSDGALASAVGRVLRAKLDQLPVVEVAGTPALSFDDLQLAVGCMGETDACLDAIAGQLEVDALVLSRVDHAGDALVLTVTFYDADKDERQSVVRRAEGPHADNALLEGVDGQLRELFGLPAPEEPAGPVPGAPGSTEPTDEGPGAPVWPIVLGGAGVAALVGGGVLLVMAGKTADDYAAVDVRNTNDVARARDLYDKSHRQANIGYGLLAAGGALAAGGIVVFFLTRPEDEGEAESSGVAVAPVFGAGEVGVSLAGRFGGLR